ncbi:hypothetical protein OPT61_g4343 [Boeremia exigua]|uniref:Uncharacterized protein n=1 Tax=Boeremia exigua TaxID=749465 RepID=A0ACC2IEI5_9PLEO|nr:hypothetical protein OPT61_g4343 [Boeremia exigua]
MSFQHQQQAAERMHRMDYGAFLMNRGLFASPYSAQLFTIERTNKKRPVRNVVFTDGAPRASGPAATASPRDPQIHEAQHVMNTIASASALHSSMESYLYELQA